MPLTAQDLEQLLHLIEEHPQKRAQFRSLLVIDELHALPVRMDRVEAALQQLAEAQQRTEQRLNELVEWQRGEAGRREGERYCNE